MRATSRGSIRCPGFSETLVAFVISVAVGRFTNRGQRGDGEYDERSAIANSGMTDRPRFDT